MSYLDPLTLMLNLVFMCQLCDVFCHRVIYSSVWKAIIFYWGKWFGIVDRSLLWLCILSMIFMFHESFYACESY